MKLWLISRTDRVSYDDYDSAVVAAKTEKSARLTHPSGYKWNGKADSSWADAKTINVQYIGVSDREFKNKTVICASFNAG